MKFNILAKGAFTSDAGELVDVIIDTTKTYKGEPKELRFVKEGAVTLSCEGQLIIDKLHNTRAVVRIYSDDRNELEELIGTYLSNDDDTVRLTIGHNGLFNTYRGLLDMEGIEYHESTAYGYVLELVFGDLNPLKRIKADTKGGLYSLDQIAKDWLRYITTPYFEPDDDTGFLINFKPKFYPQSDFKFDKSLAGDDPSVYDVLEVCAEAMCGSLRQTEGCFSIVTAPTSISTRGGDDVANIVEGISYATGRAYNTFEYSLKGDQVQSKDYKLMGVDSVVQVERGKKCSTLPSSFYSQKDSGYRRGRGDQDYYERASHSSRPANSFITKKGYITPAVSETKREQYLLGFPMYNEEYIDGELAFGRIVDVDISRVTARADEIRGVVAQLEEVIKSPVVTMRAYSFATASYLDVLAEERNDPTYAQRAKLARSIAETVSEDALYDGDLNEMRTKFTAYISELNAIIAKKEAIVKQMRGLEIEPATAIAVRRDDTSEWRSGFVLAHGKDLFNLESFTPLRGVKTKIKAKGDKTPISISIGGGTAVLGDDIRDFLDKNVPELYMSKENEIPHLLLEVDITCSGGGKSYVLNANSQSEKAGTKWVADDSIAPEREHNYLDLGQVLSEELGATINLPPLPAGVDTIDVVYTGKWYVGFENFTWAVVEGGKDFYNLFKWTEETIRRSMIDKYEQLCKHDWGIIFYLNRFEVSQGLDVAYKDRRATLTINDGRQFDEVLTYETRIGTALGTGANLLDRDGNIVKGLISDVWLNAEPQFKPLTKHEAFLLYALALVYSRRYNSVEFTQIKFSWLEGLGEFFYFVDDRLYFAEKYEFDLSRASVTYTARQMPRLDDRRLMMLAEQASIAMTAGSYSKGGEAGSKGVTRTTTGRRR